MKEGRRKGRKEGSTDVADGRKEGGKQRCDGRKEGRREALV